MFKQVKHILPRLLEKHGFNEQAKTIEIVQLFEQYLNEHCNEFVQQSCHGMYVQNKCFYIGVTANAAAQEMQMHKEALLAYLSMHFDGNEVEDIRCKVVHS